MHALEQHILERPGTLRGRIGVGLDVTPGARAAVGWATEEAIAGAATLTACHVRPGGDPAAAQPDLDELALTEPVVVREIHWVRRILGGSRVDVELPAGPVAGALLDLAGRADLLVVGAHSGVDPLHHAVPVRLAAQAPCPVVIVRPVPAHGDAPFAGHVVVGVDGSPAAAAALRFGFAHAQAHRVPLVAVHVDDRRPGDFWTDDRFLETHFAAEPSALELLARQVEPVAAEHPAVAVKRGVFGGDPVTGLRRAATGARLLVIGRHGHRLPAVLRLGSVSRAFAERADCVVAITPDHDHPHESFRRCTS